MDKVTYKAWWPLHLRAVSGETLSIEERAFYEVKLAQLHQEEVIQENVSDLRESRAEIQRLETERLELRLGVKDCRRQSWTWERLSASQRKKRWASGSSDLARPKHESIKS